ncbi:MAG: hypothetical protein JNJ54_15085 [Myxococcaceae bacterium]|nr:hypothetical protein [Myxococcaceae bacterium]
MTLLALVLAAGPCAGCHLEVHERFAKTRHARAHDEPLFLASWQRVSRRPWCASCHDPLGGGRGLTCELCHDDVARQLEGHEQRRSEAVSPDLCAHCHQFAAPEPELAAVPMQNTVAEWRRARAAGERRSCADCHFANAEHGEHGGHGPTAVEVRVGDDGCFRLATPDVGHSTPTGDPFHRLRLRLCADEACATPVATRWFRRTFARTDAGVVELEDTRLPAGVLGARVECFTPSANVTSWRLEALHAEHGLGEVPEEELVRVLAKGPVSWRRGTQRR